MMMMMRLMIRLYEYSATKASTGITLFSATPYTYEYQRHYKQLFMLKVAKAQFYMLLSAAP